jgi:hypothetical protein
VALALWPQGSDPEKRPRTPEEGEGDDREARRARRGNHDAWTRGPSGPDCECSRRQDAGVTGFPTCPFPAATDQDGYSLCLSCAWRMGVPEGRPLIPQPGRDSRCGVCLGPYGRDDPRELGDIQREADIRDGHASRLVGLAAALERRGGVQPAQRTRFLPRQRTRQDAVRDEARARLQSMQEAAEDLVDSARHAQTALREGMLRTPTHAAWRETPQGRNQQDAADEALRASATASLALSREVSRVVALRTSRVEREASQDWQMRTELELIEDTAARSAERRQQMAAWSAATADPEMDRHESRSEMLTRE